MKLIETPAAWATNSLTPDPELWPKGNALLDAEEGKPLHRVLRKGRYRKLVESMTKEGWIGRPLVAYIDCRSNILFLTGSHRWAAARETGTKIPTLLLDLSRHDYSGDCMECKGFARWEEYECPCEVLVGYREYVEVEKSLRNLGFQDAADLFLADSRPYSRS